MELGADRGLSYDVPAAVAVAVRAPVILLKHALDT